MSTDTLSDVLRAVRLTGAVFYDVSARDPWVAAAPPASLIAAQVMPDAEHVIEFHAVIQGGCWAGVVGQDSTRLEAGDVIVFPQGDPHVLSSAPGQHTEPDMRPYTLDRNDRPFKLSPGPSSAEAGAGEATQLVCGFLGCDARPFNPLLNTLPRVLHLRSQAAAPSTSLRLFLELALQESRQPRPGGECVLAKLSELLFVEAVRRHIDSLPAEEQGWLAGLRDEVVGRALSLLHTRPAHPWTIDELGRAVGLSRSALAERFTHFVGQPPMQYLSQWRMQLAARLLREGSASVASIAEEAGYASEAAFSRAFKKAVGTPPATWRAAGSKARSAE
jgi:AraC-like DNA-binding protein